MGKVSGLSVEVSGRENLPPERPNEFNIFVPNHVDAFLDAYVGSQLGIKDYITVGALNLKGTKMFSLAVDGNSALLKQIDKSDHFFLLGRGYDTLDRIVNAVKEKKSRNLFIFTQGMISLGLQETNPVRDGLPRIIEGIQKLGIRVNLIPITMPDNARFLRFDSGYMIQSDSGSQLRAVFEKPLSPEALATMSQLGQLSSLESFLRVDWLSSLTTNSTHLLGMKRWRESLEEIRRRGWLPPSATNQCSELFGPG